MSAQQAPRLYAVFGLAVPGAGAAFYRRAHRARWFLAPSAG